MSGTLDLAALADQARQAGAKLLLVGDHHQLGPSRPAARSGCSPGTATPRHWTGCGGSASVGKPTPPGGSAPATPPASTPTPSTDGSPAATTTP